MSTEYNLKIQLKYFILLYVVLINDSRKMFLNSLVKNVKRGLTLQTVERYINNLCFLEFEHNLTQATRTLCSAIKFDDKLDQKNQRTIGATENQNVSQIEFIFKCNTEKAAEIFNVLKKPQPNLYSDDLVSKVKWLRRRNIQLSTILDNYKLLLQPLDDIKSVYKYLKKMDWNKPDHILPFVSISLKEIKKLETVQVNRIRTRVYWLAAELQTDPYIISKNCVKHPFILSYNDLVKLRRKIQLLWDYGITTEGIVKDFFNLTLGEENLKRRLEFLKANGIEYILPWMLRARDDAIQKILELRNELDPEEIQSLDNLANLLKLHGHTARKIFKSRNYIRTLDKDQMSSVLQFLLEKFTADEIVKNIRMLRWPLTELKRRVSNAEALRIEHLDPICLAKKNKDFQEWLEDSVKRRGLKSNANDDIHVK